MSKLIVTIQLKLTMNSSTPETSKKLDVEIADFMHTSSLSLSASKDTKIQAIIWFAKHVLCGYIMPSSFSITGLLLEVNYNVYVSKVMKSTSSNASMFGLTIYGNIAMFDKRPIINIILVLTNEPQAAIYGGFQIVNFKRWCVECPLPCFSTHSDIERQNWNNKLLTLPLMEQEMCKEVTAAKSPKVLSIHLEEHIASLFWMLLQMKNLLFWSKWSLKLVEVFLYQSKVDLIGWYWSCLEEKSDVCTSWLCLS